jgi:hypothetical protein
MKLQLSSRTRQKTKQSCAAWPAKDFPLQALARAPHASVPPHPPIVTGREESPHSVDLPKPGTGVFCVPVTDSPTGSMVQGVFTEPASGVLPSSRGEMTLWRAPNRAAVPRAVAYGPDLQLSLPDAYVPP